MTLIKSISGIRGTIGGAPGENLTPLDVVKFASAYGTWLLQTDATSQSKKVVIGRDARTTGPSITQLVSQTLIQLGIDVVDVGLSTTPTVEVAVTAERASGGIVISASHNPEVWNALKLLNHAGEFLSAKDGEQILAIAEKGSFNFSAHDQFGRYTSVDTYLDYHIELIGDLPLVNRQAIRDANFSIAVDGVNSSGGIAVPRLLRALGVTTITEICCEPTGIFKHNPEPLPEHLQEIASAVQFHKADLGFVVDPDVDRLAIISETGEMFGEEYTLVAVADYLLKKTSKTDTRRNRITISNLSSSRALRDVSHSAGSEHVQSAVGEVNVVTMMKEKNALIGGEGNGGIIYPELHYGRDALVGIALFLSHLAEAKLRCSELRASYPAYFISKNKIQVPQTVDITKLLDAVRDRYKEYPITTVDGVKIDLPESWIHLRRSNTEPIIRIYTEAKAQDKADSLAQSLVEQMKSILSTIA